MGWTSMYKHKGDSVDTIFRAGWGSKFEILASACKGFCWYAAIKHLTDGPYWKAGEVFAAVYAYKYHPKSAYNFSYKDMDESVMPYYFDCPAHILDMLTPTDNKYANEWRTRCRAKLRAYKPKNGDVIRLNRPLRFTNGVMVEYLTLIPYGKRLVWFACDVQHGQIQPWFATSFNPNKRDDYFICAN